jgi:uncharacterized protein (DUF433 family)
MAMSEAKLQSPHRIVATPGTCSGQPRIDGTRIPTKLVRDRFMAGESIASIAADYDLPTDVIDAALRFEMLPRWRRRVSP